MSSYSLDLPGQDQNHHRDATPPQSMSIRPRKVLIRPMIISCYSGPLAGAATHPRQRLHKQRLRQPCRGHEQARAQSAQIRISLAHSRRLERFDAGVVSGPTSTQVGSGPTEGRDIQNAKRFVGGADPRRLFADIPFGRRPQSGNPAETALRPRTKNDARRASRCGCCKSWIPLIRLSFFDSRSLGLRDLYLVSRSSARGTSV